MKVYEVECLAVITVEEEDMETAALHGAALVKDNPHLISVRAVHERNVEPGWEDSSTRMILSGRGPKPLPFVFHYD